MHKQIFGSKRLAQFRAMKDPAEGVSLEPGKCRAEGSGSQQNP